MRRILFDMTVYQTGTVFHGGGEYCYAVLKELMDARTEEVTVDAFISEKGRKDDKMFERCREAGMKLFTCKNAEELSELVQKGNYDVLYSALPTKIYFEGLYLPENVLMIITLHGLRKLELRESGLYQYFTNLRNCKKDIREIMNRIFRYGKYMDYLKDEYNYLLNITENYIAVTASYHSYYNTLRYFPQIGKERLRMCYSPTKLGEMMENAEYENKLLGEYGIRTRNFGLVLSADRFEKNPLRSVRAWDEVFSDYQQYIPKDYKAVILGAEKNSSLKNAVKNKDRFIFKGYVDTKELEVLYKHTHLLLFASLNEGFGYPPMEAMKYGTLVAASVNTAIPESCGNAALMFNPLIVSEIVNRILQGFDPAIRQEKEDEIPKQYQKIIKRQKEDLKRVINIILTGE